MKIMANYDPFSGGSDFSREEEKPKGQALKLSPNMMSLIKKIIILIIVLGVIGIVVYFLFFNTVTIEFNVKDIYGKSIPTEIKIIPENSKKTITVSSGDSVKLNKSKEYTYTITKTGYETLRTQQLSLEEEEINIVLSKDIRLEVTAFTCPTTVFTGQIVKCQIDLKNLSPNEDYNSDFLEFFGANISNWPDFNNQTYVFVDNYGEELPISRQITMRKMENTFFVSFNIPANDKLANTTKKISLRVKGTDKNKTAELNIQKAPDIKFTSALSSAFAMKSGDEITKAYKIDNTKNKIELSDLELSITANYVPEDSSVDINIFDIEEIFTLNHSVISVNSNDDYEDIITIDLPGNLRRGKINGALSLNSPMFVNSKDINFTITVEEPLNNFEISINKNSETLTYDVNTHTTNSKSITLNLNNKNKIPVHINNIFINNSTNTTDCNSWFTLPTGYNDQDIPANENPAIPIVISGSDLGTLTNITGTKYCTLKVEYIHPFTLETITVPKEIQISVN